MRYGHQKIEFMASGLEGALILVAAVFIAVSAAKRLSHPAMPEMLGIGMVLVLLSTVVNAGVGYLLLREGRRTESIVLEADGHHLMTGVWTTVGVVAGLLLVLWLREPRLDPIIAILVAANIVRVASSLLRRSFDGLMDHALTPTENAGIRAAIEEKIQPPMKYHALRTRRSGTRPVDWQSYSVAELVFKTARRSGLGHRNGGTSPAELPSCCVPPVQLPCRPSSGCSTCPNDDGRTVAVRRFSMCLTPNEGGRFGAGPQPGMIRSAFNRSNSSKNDAGVGW